MAQATSIEWATDVWNPTTGCDQISEECDHCYAKDQAARLKRFGQAAYQNDGDPRTSGPGFALTMHPGRLDQPAHWRKPRRVFVNSMSDLFHKDVTEEFIRRVWWQMALAPQHQFLILTKRPKRMRNVVREIYEQPGQLALAGVPYPLPNVWLGTSIGLRQYVWRADRLRETPAAVRFISAEPLLGPLVHDVREGWECIDGEYWGWPGEWSDGHEGPQLDLTDIDWLILGGESGSRHRPLDVQWIRDLRDAAMAQRDCCDTCGGYGALDALHGGPAPMAGPVIPCPGRHTAIFVKQLGGHRPGTALEDLPEDLRIREFPR